MDSSEEIVTFTALVALSATKVGMMWWAKNHPKRVWRKVGKVSALYVHPLKSARGISLDEAEIKPMGIQYQGAIDRHFLLTDNEYRRINKKEPKLALITPSLHGTNIHFDAPGMETLILPKVTKETSENFVECCLDDELHGGITLGKDVDKWFQKYLERDDLKFIIPRKFLDDSGSKHKNFYFVKPYMIMSQSSLDDLNTKLPDSESQMRCFRPNIVIEGSPAYSEDNWEEMQIADVKFKFTWPCHRCIITTFDPDNAEKHSKMEPLTTLKTYRLDKEVNKSVLGRYGASLNDGKIRVGDDVYAW